MHDPFLPFGGGEEYWFDAMCNVQCEDSNVRQYFERVHGDISGDAALEEEDPGGWDIRYMQSAMGWTC